MIHAGFGRARLQSGHEVVLKCVRALAPEVSFSHPRRLFPQPLQPCRPRPRKMRALAPDALPAFPIAPSLSANSNNLLRPQRLVACAALGIQKPQQLLQSIRIRGVAQKRTLASNPHQPLTLQLFQMMRQRRTRNAELLLKFPNHQPLRMRRQQQLHNPQTSLGPHRRKHIGIPHHLIPVDLFVRSHHRSIFAEIWNIVKRKKANQNRDRSKGSAGPIAPRSSSHHGIHF
jgi:hypothetical protein